MASTHRVVLGGANPKRGGADARDAAAAAAAAAAAIVAAPAFSARELRVVDDRGAWCAGERLRAHLLTDASSFVVVGVMGTKSTGKSDLAGTFVGFPSTVGVCGGEESAEGGAPGETRGVRVRGVGGNNQNQSQSRSAAASSSSSSSPPPPSVLGQPPFERDTTRAVSIRVAEDRVICVDTPPLFAGERAGRRSTSVAGAGGKTPPPPAAAAERERRVASRLARWLLRTCHVVVVMGEDDDARAAEAMVAAAREEEEEEEEDDVGGARERARIVFCQTRVPASRAMRLGTPTAPTTRAAIESLSTREEEDAAAAAVFVLPEVDDGDGVSRRRHDEVARELRRFVFASERRAFVGGVRGERGKVSEREWLGIARRAWAECVGGAG